MSDWSWKLRLFASADLVGSTAYKQSASDREGRWAPTFKEFFRDFPTAVESAYGSLPKKCPPCSEKLAPWKFSGDEILFWTRLTKSAQVISHLAAFKDAVSKFPSAWQDKGVPLKLKATAWLAGFPVTNTEIEIPAGSSHSLDFIGPSIDLGFRIARFADTQRFILSADLALMALDAIHNTEVAGDSFHFHFHGKESLKGVIGNEPYPIVWLDVFDGKQTREEQLLGIKRESKPQILRDFLLEFLEKTPGLIRPFIDGDSDAKYGQIPESHVVLRDKMMSEESGRGYLSEQSEPSNPGEKKDFPEPKVQLVNKRQKRQRPQRGS